VSDGKVALVTQIVTPTTDTCAATLCRSIANEIIAGQDRLPSSSSNPSAGVQITGDPNKLALARRQLHRSRPFPSFDTKPVRLVG
jgi:hypothetical protein